MSQNTPEFTRPQLRRLNREYKRNVKQGTKDAKAAVTLSRRDRNRFDPAAREAIGRSNLTAADLSAMMQRSVTGTVDGQARDDLAALGQAAQGRVRPERTSSPSLAGMVANAYSRWRDVRRGTKLLKAASALAAKDIKTIDPVIRAQLGHSTMTRGDLSALAQRNLTEAFRSPGDFEVRPGVQAPEAIDLPQPAPAAQPPDQRLDALRAEVAQLREQITHLEAEIARLEAAQPQPEQAQQATAEQSTDQQAQQPASDQDVGQHQAVPTDRAEAQEQLAVQQSGEQGARVPAAQASPRGTAQPVFQAAGQPATTRPGERPRVEAPEFRAAGESNAADQRGHDVKQAAAAFDGVARPTAPGRPAAQGEKPTTQRGHAQTNSQKHDPHSRG